MNHHANGRELTLDDPMTIDRQSALNRRAATPVRLLRRRSARTRRRNCAHPTGVRPATSRCGARQRRACARSGDCIVVVARRRSKRGARIAARVTDARPGRRATSDVLAPPLRTAEGECAGPHVAGRKRARASSCRSYRPVRRASREANPRTGDPRMSPELPHEAAMAHRASWTSIAPKLAIALSDQ